MKKQSNFTKAVEELMKGTFMGSAADSDKPVNTPAVETAEWADSAEASETFGANLSEIEDVAAPRPDFTASPMASVHRVQTRTAEAIITEDMVIKGTITSTANISISGTVLGDVSSQGDVVVRGKIEGNVNVRSLSVQTGTINGDIVSTGTVIIAENSSVDGNIKADRIEVNGKVTGNLESAAKVVLNPRSVIEGSVTALELAMSEGAELKGNVNVRRTE